MTITTEACSDLNERLLSLGIGCTVHVTLEDINDVKLSTEFLTNSNVLLNELRKYDTNILIQGKCSSVKQIYAALRDRMPYFSDSTENIQYKLLLFLITEVQIERLAASQSSEDTAMEPECDEDADDIMDCDESGVLSEREHSVLAFQLDKVCKLLQVQVGATSDLQGVLSAVQTSVANALQSDPTLLSDPPPALLSGVGSLTAQQRAKLVAVEDMIHKDFALRRQMLLRRMAVTVESFLWSEKASCREHEGEIRAAVRSQQHHLAAPPRRYQLADALCANVALLHEQSKKVTGDSQLAASSSSGATKSVIKQILVGEVPDRGGRANEVRPKQLRAEVRRAFGGGGGSGGKSTKGTGEGNQKNTNSTSNNSNTKDGTGAKSSLKGTNSTSGGRQSQAGGGGAGNSGQQRDQNAAGAAIPTSSGSTGGGNKKWNKSANQATSSSERRADSGRQVSVVAAPEPAPAQKNQPKQKQRSSGAGSSANSSNSKS